MTVLCLLSIVALILAVASLVTRVPIGAPVILLALIEVLRCLPLR